MANPNGNPQNLIPMKKGSKRAKILGRKGGKKNTILQSFRLRKFCNDSCPIHKDCWAKQLAFNEMANKINEWEDKVKEEKIRAKAEKRKPKKIKRPKFKPKCFLKEKGNQELLNTTIALLREGEEGFNKEMIKMLLFMKKATNTWDSKEIQPYIKTIKEVKESVYGSNSKVTAKIEGEVPGLERLFEIIRENNKQK